MTRFEWENRISANKDITMINRAIFECWEVNMHVLHMY